MRGFSHSIKIRRNSEGDERVDYVSFGRILLDRRKEIGLTREKAGELIGISGATIQNWEIGKNLPD